MILKLINNKRYLVAFLTLLILIGCNNKDNIKYSYTADIISTDKGFLTSTSDNKIVLINKKKLNDRKVLIEEDSDFHQFMSNGDYILSLNYGDSWHIYDVICYSIDGKQLWRRDSSAINSPYKFFEDGIFYFAEVKTVGIDASRGLISLFDLNKETKKRNFIITSILNHGMPLKFNNGVFDILPEITLDSSKFNNILNGYLNFDTYKKLNISGILKSDDRIFLSSHKNDSLSLFQYYPQNKTSEIFCKINITDAEIKVIKDQIIVFNNKAIYILDSKQKGGKSIIKKITSDSEQDIYVDVLIEDNTLYILTPEVIKKEPLKANL